MWQARRGNLPLNPHVSHCVCDQSVIWFQVSSIGVPLGFHRENAVCVCVCVSVLLPMCSCLCVLERVCLWVGAVHVLLNLTWVLTCAKWSQSPDTSLWWRPVPYIAGASLGAQAAHVQEAEPPDGLQKTTFKSRWGRGSEHIWSACAQFSGCWWQGNQAKLFSCQAAVCLSSTCSWSSSA